MSDLTTNMLFGFIGCALLMIALHIEELFNLLIPVSIWFFYIGLINR